MLITKENYFSQEANKEYMGSTQFKSFLDCEAQAMERLSGGWTFKSSDAMLQGSYVHAYFEGPEALDIFISKHPEIISSRGATKGELKTTFKTCEKCINVIENDLFFMRSLDGEKEVYFTAEMFGTKWKILIDSYNEKEKRFTDLKTLKSLSEKYWDNEGKCYVNSLEKFGYYYQISIYAEIERLANGRPEGDYFEPFISIITKEYHPDKAIVSFNSDEMSYGEFIQENLQFIEVKMPRILKLKSGEAKPIRCETCDYCKSTKVIKKTTHFSTFGV